ncbi:hypothetical protein LX36DRAFT_655748 [Colletotrichum falcatum]|nr:hypothetical protein LX36DRAFT_655748 [Colletotrichum falcatum]
MRFTAVLGLFSLAAALPATPADASSDPAVPQSSATPISGSTYYNWPATATPLVIEFYPGAKLSIQSLDLTNVKVDCTNKADQNAEFIISDTQTQALIYSYKVKVNESCATVSFPKGDNMIMITTKMGYF